jgi:DNA-binding NarL/FixJ family response regulator
MPASVSQSQVPVRIAIVDDVPVFRRSLRSALERQPGLEIVAEADDGRQAIELANRHRPDVILMDLSMPVLNGIDATRVITSSHPTIRVIILSMHASESADEAVRAGACLCIGKERKIREILESILECCLPRD